MICLCSALNPLSIECQQNAYNSQTQGQQIQLAEYSLRRLPKNLFEYLHELHFSVTKIS